MVGSLKEQLDKLRRGTVEITPEKDFEEKLKESVEKRKPLRVKLGLDPTSPDIHLGHTVVLRKLRQFQEFGHQVIVIIGSFTGLIGDPSGRNEMRKPLTKEEIDRNAKTYQDQVFKILDPKKTQIVYNDSWLGRLTTVQVVQLAGQYTVARMLERDDFSKRFREKTPIGVHEFLYPLFQGYDSFEINSDVELGGTDQTFNLLVGREIQKAYGKPSQCIMTMPLLEGTDGVQKMSKSLGNHIGITESPREMFGKIMRISDEMMWKYYELLTEVPLEELSSMRKEAEAAKANPRDMKVRLGKIVVSAYHSEKEADSAEKEFNQIFQKGGLPDEIETVMIRGAGEIKLLDLIVQAGCAPTKAEARRLVDGGGVFIDDKKQTSPLISLPAKGELLLKVGKRRFRKIKFVP
ncbi:MAG TPA: tyrosine--tRNA ligase [Bdellovibrionota bacterium]|nr:tyrosine--tRNA ligase [Bdellovibrionota bacterium]